MVKKIYVTWDDFASQVELLTQKLRKCKDKFDGIYGVPKGGLIMAVMLCHRLNLPLLLTPTKNSLVVDEISDSGKTLFKVKNKKIACIFSTSWTKSKPDFYTSTKKSKDDWLVFPWEDG